jgi:predicted ATP-grasp superfamily ATP-dependent carboligase
LIQFTRRSVRVGRRFCEQMRLWNADCEFPLVADIPHEGELIAAKHPVATVFAQARDEERVESQLQARAAELDALLDAAAVR